MSDLTGAVGRALAAEYADSYAEISARREALVAEAFPTRKGRAPGRDAHGHYRPVRDARFAGNFNPAPLPTPESLPVVVPEPEPEPEPEPVRHKPRSVAQKRADFIEDLEWLIDSGERCRSVLAARLGLPTVEALERRCFRFKLHRLLAKTYHHEAETVLRQESVYK